MACPCVWREEEYHKSAHVWRFSASCQSPCLTRSEAENHTDSGKPQGVLIGFRLHSGMGNANTNDALLTDLYEITMAAGYFERRLPYRATFELFVRSLSPERTFLLACGLESALDYLENVHFTEEHLDFLRRQPVFHSVSDSFFEYLRNFRFTGEVCALPEGTVAFAEEPLLQVTAPVAEAQLVETYLLSVINYETLVATKAARVVRAAAAEAPTRGEHLR